MTPKPRTKLRNLPKYVTASNGRIVYRPRIQPADRQYIDTDKSGFLKPPVRLGNEKDPDDVIIKAYMSAKSSLDTRLGAEKHSLAWITDQYQHSRAFAALAIGSQQRATALTGILKHPVTIDGQAKTFGDLQISQVKPTMVRRLADKRLADYQAKGRKGVAMVNREITFLSTATKWAIENIDNLGINGNSNNPFRIGKFTETPSDRYVTDAEYNLQRTLAARIADYLPLVFELTYLVAARGIETLDITLADIDSNRETGGIYIARRKGSKSNTIEWTDRLYQCYLDIKKLHNQHKISTIDAPLFISQRGARLTKSGLDSAMQRLKKLMKKQGCEEKYWRLHDLKRKGLSDSANNRIAGHRSEKMREQYNTKPERHPAAR